MESIPKYIKVIIKIIEYVNIACINKVEVQDSGVSGTKCIQKG